MLFSKFDITRRGASTPILSDEVDEVRNIVVMPDHFVIPRTLQTNLKLMGHQLNQSSKNQSLPRRLRSIKLGFRCFECCQG